MPYVQDKIIINSKGGSGNNAVISGNAKGIDRVLEGAEIMGDEIASNGWLTEAEALNFKGRMEKLCDAFHAAQKIYQHAQLDYKDGVEALVDDMRNWIDKKLMTP